MKNIKKITCIALAMPIFANASVMSLDIESLDVNDFIIAAGGYHSLVIGSAANVDGNIASGWYTGLASGTTINGDSCSPYTSAGAGATVTGISAVCPSLYNLESEIAQLSTQASGFDGKNIGDITSNYILDVSGHDVFDLGSINIDSGESIVVSGTAEESVIINVYGDAIFGSGSSIILSGGITSNNVLFNFVSNPTAGFNVGAAELNGTFLSYDRDFVIGDGATLDDTRFWSNGSMIANIQDLSYVGGTGGSIPSIDPENPSTSVSIGHTIALLAIGLFGLVRRRFVKRSSE